LKLNGLGDSGNASDFAKQVDMGERGP
jgi:hypothetical protein